MQNNKANIAVILGSIRPGRNGDKVAKWFFEATKNNQNANLTLLDLLNYPLPIFADSDAIRYRQGQHPDSSVQKWIDTVNSYSGYIFLVTEYNRSLPSVLKNALDYPYKEWQDKPLGIVSYGGFAGGARAAEHLRTVAGELHMYDIREQVVIPKVWEAFDENGNLKDSEALSKTANMIVDKVAELSNKLKI